MCSAKKKPKTFCTDFKVDVMFDLVFCFVFLFGLPQKWLVLSTQKHLKYVGGGFFKEHTIPRHSVLLG